ncbi:hypothetical protein K2173_022025 [Erythroxylum novogranatense]|uniref:DNA-directed RNA polymerase n=1 Tax=Erythroxylum novogranatense TaxID=1862640 RepID=A0AAV8T2L0_9ROSI|nr:hypothetical protein K2173_022025 [Erythroxylum novogranatense]
MAKDIILEISCDLFMLDDKRLVRGLVKQHLDSFNYFVNVGIKKIVCANDRIVSTVDPSLYLRFRDVRIGTPSLIVDGIYTKTLSFCHHAAVNKDELLQMVRVGAEMVFSLKDITITDDDIDKIIAKGEEATTELDTKMKKFMKDAIKFKVDESFFVDINLFKANKHNAIEIARNHKSVVRTFKDDSEITAKEGLMMMMQTW